MEEAAELAESGQIGKARAMLEALDQRYARRPEVLTDLINLCIEMNDLQAMRGYGEELLEITPNDADVMHLLAGAYMVTVMPSLALRTLRRFVERFPEDERTAKARHDIARLEPQIAEIIANSGLVGEAAEESALLFEQSRSLMDRGQYAKSSQKAEAVLRLYPDFVPAINNLSQMCAIEGHLDDAIQFAERVLVLDEENFHALSNLSRFLFFKGRSEDAQQIAERLKTITSDNPDHWVKQVEAFSYLGDDESVLDIYQKAEEAGYATSEHVAGLFLHLVAVAALRLGRESDARHYWKKALARSPGLEVALANLESLSLPVGERHAPFPFHFNQWVAALSINELISRTKAISKQAGDKALRQSAQQYMRDHPEIEELLPALLDRGDQGARQFVMMIINLVRAPKMLAALRDFALGQRGPDQLRMQAAQVAVEEGLLPSGQLRMYMRGGWSDVMLLGFQIHGDPDEDLPPKAERLMAKAFAALRENNPQEAETLLKQVLEIIPDLPGALNNLALAYEQQGRQEEAHALIQEVHARFPEYFFGIVAVAHLAIAAGDTERAESLLQSLLGTKRLHYTEFEALCNAQIELCLAQKKRDAARSWLGMWKKIESDDPRIEAWDRQLNKPDWRAQLFGR